MSLTDTSELGVIEMVKTCRGLSSECLHGFCLLVVCTKELQARQ